MDENKKDDAVVEEAAVETKEEVAAEAPAVEEKKEETKEEVKEEVKEEAPAADEGEDVEVPAKFKTIVDGVESLSVLDLHELVKLLEKKFGVSAAAVAVAGPAAGADAGEEKSSFTVKLTAIGDGKVAVIKVVKEVCGLGLKEAKELVEGAPVEVKKDLKKDEADEIKTKLEEAGGQVELV